MKTPRIEIPRRGISVRWESQLCDRHGRIERVLQRGTNMITDFGMDSMATTHLATNIAYLHLGSTTETLKRVLPGGNAINLGGTDPAGITVTADSNFFEAGDAGRVLKIAGWPELLVTGFTSATVVTVRSRASLWPPGFTPPGTGPFTDVGVHYTNVATLAAEFTRFNTYDTAAAKYNHELTDSANSRFIYQNIFLSGVVTGSPWTVNELGWGPNTANCFGKTNLGSPDVVAVGKKYRVVLQVLDAYTPIDLSGVTLDWGGTVGSYTADIRMERIGLPSSNLSIVNPGCWLRRATLDANARLGYFTSAVTLQTIAWQPDAGFTTISRTAVQYTTGSVVFDSTYTNGDFRKTRTARWPDDLAITNATGLYVGSGGSFPALTIKPTANINKASGYRIDILFAIVWQRTLSN